MVQMSQRWIEHNINRAVDDRSIATEIKTYGTVRYSRHLFYTPAYLPCVLQHLEALRNGKPSETTRHKDHSIPSTHQHGEGEVKAAVNHKLTKLGLACEP